MIETMDGIVAIAILNCGWGSGDASRGRSQEKS